MAGPVEVALGVLVENVGITCRVLITRRRPDQVLGGFWEFPGGKLEAGEDARGCVVREFKEELGIGVEPYQRLETIEHAYDHALVRLHPMLCRHLHGEPRNLEVAEHRWVELADLGRYRFLPANTGLLTQVRSCLGGPDDRAPSDAGTGLAR